MYFPCPLSQPSTGFGSAMPSLPILSPLPGMYHAPRERVPLALAPWPSHQLTTTTHLPRRTVTVFAHPLSPGTTNIQHSTPQGSPAVQRQYFLGMDFSIFHFWYGLKWLLLACDQSSNQAFLQRTFVFCSACQYMHLSIPYQHNLWWCLSKNLGDSKNLKISFQDDNGMTTEKSRFLWDASRNTIVLRFPTQTYKQTGSFSLKPCNTCNTDFLSLQVPNQDARGYKNQMPCRICDCISMSLHQTIL